MFGTTVAVGWEGRSVDAFVPALLADLAAPDRQSARAAALAEGALAAINALVADRLEVPARLLLRAEGIASSRIEALEVAPADLAVARVDAGAVGVVAEVADNLAALDLALAHRGRLSVEDLFAWHEVLVARSALAPEHRGAWRDRLGWVGGPTPMRAAHVAAPHEAIPHLMADLLAYLEGDRHDPVVQAAVAHAQFETIHPFPDGNGGLGRLLIGWVLRRRLGMAVPPPLSVTFLRDIGGYLAGLTRYRLDGPDPWIRWFGSALEGSATAALRTLRAIEDLERSWPTLLDGIRTDAAAHRLVPLLVAHPALNVATTASLLGIGRETARVALDTLATRGVLRPVEVAPTGPGRPRRWWVAGELLDLLGR